MKSLVFFVPGIPAPQGSMRAFMPKGARFPVVTADNPKTKPWRSTIGVVALDAMHRQDWHLAEGPLTVELLFGMPRPKSLPKRVTHMTKKPDIDKLIRAVLDALKGVAWCDDSQVVSVYASKRYGQPGCKVEIFEVSA